jgi:hypothetical protein
MINGGCFIKRLIIRFLMANNWRLYTLNISQLKNKDKTLRAN